MERASQSGMSRHNTENVFQICPKLFPVSTVTEFVRGERANRTLITL